MNNRIDQYLALVKSCPKLFRSVEAYPLCVDRDVLIQFEKDTGQEVGVIVRNQPYNLVLGDVIIGKDGKLFRHIRVVPAVSECGGSVILPVWRNEDGEMLFGLLCNDRHAPRMEALLELPRGHLENGMDAQSSAVREMVEELGCDSRNIGNIIYLGQAHVDTGLTAALVHYYEITIRGPRPTGNIGHEGIHGVYWCSKEELLRLISATKITDSFTHIAVLKHILASDSK